MQDDCTFSHPAFHHDMICFETARSVWRVAGQHVIWYSCCRTSLCMSRICFAALCGTRAAVPDDADVFPGRGEVATRPWMHLQVTTPKRRTARCATPTRIFRRNWRSYEAIWTQPSSRISRPLTCATQPSQIVSSAKCPRATTEWMSYPIRTTMRSRGIRLVCRETLVQEVQHREDKGCQAVDLSVFMLVDYGPVSLGCCWPRVLEPLFSFSHKSYWSPRNRIYVPMIAVWR